MANLIYRISVTPNTPTTTYSKNAPLTNLEIDGNFKSLNDAIDAKAGINSPSFTGVPSVPNAAIDTATTQIASTSFVVNQGYLKIDVASVTYAPLVSPTFTGNVVVNSSLTTNNVQIGQSDNATNNFVIGVPVVPNGTMKISRGNLGSTTQDVISIDSAGDVTLGTSGKAVGTTGTQTLINKTIAFSNNTMVGVASTDTAQLLTNKTLISPVINLGGTSGNVGQILVSQGNSSAPAWTSPEDYFVLRQPGNLQLYTGIDRWYAPFSLNITTITARLSSVADSAVTVVIKKSSGGDVTSTTLIIAANENKAIITPDINMNIDDFLTVDVTTIGTTAKGAGLTVNFKYTQF